MSLVSPVYFKNAAARITESPEGFAVVKWHKGVRKPEDFRAVLRHLDRLFRLRQ
ncbi:hypothetical protein HNQ93_000225 [Hymenobacter luteus]|uniref:Uncharacterized protein n=2 Tax=Hymenobacter TaxID=89966 RepID=A0A7W9WAJ8_9BACT|nr:MULTISPECIES: hypothetical protein [Hymenobacter]MBB4600295.1 hypothetical protein [Hymenobacter latericoloratus]MBB6057395.1 hypothetical protein [Hymenobacter luteus]